MSSLLSSPSKQAQSAASAQQGISQQAIADAEKYVDTKSGELRGAIGGLGPNPYLEAGKTLAPNAYQVNPQHTQTSTPGALPPGLTSGAPVMQPGTGAPPAFPPRPPQQPNPNPFGPPPNTPRMPM